MIQLVFRFIIGGVVVSLFAVLGDLLKPQSFAGLFGAAPSVALATLGLTIFADGKLYAAEEGRSMIAGAAAFFLYACLCVHLLARKRWGAAAATVSSLALWLVCALGLWLLLLR
ncbi:MAG TPA: DUF3147 family protein [Candidatus Limnocylindrales bacterium]|nr:DUF3147 family protein [Candidatus Limnocylindrales bacterium]